MGGSPATGREAQKGMSSWNPRGLEQQRRGLSRERREDGEAWGLRVSPTRDEPDTASLGGECPVPPTVWPVLR